MKTSATMILAGIFSSLNLPCSAASFQGLGDLPGGSFYSYATGVSADGSVVVGSSSSTSGYQAFRWTAVNGMVGLGDLSGGTFESTANGVSGDGSVVVGGSSSSAGYQAFRWTSTNGMVGLGSLPGGTFYSLAYAISADGRVIAGESRSALSGTRREAFRWTATNAMEALGDLPGGNYASEAYAVSGDGSVIVGYSSSSNGNEGFRWTAATGMAGLGDFPSVVFNSVAYGITVDGSIIVGRGYSGANGSDYTHEAFRWTAGTGLVALGFTPCDTWSIAHAVSADGSIIVGDHEQGTGDCAFIWDSQHGMRSLHQVLTSDYGLSLTGWQLSEVRAITPNGYTIVGFGTNPSGQIEGWIANIAPPSLTIRSSASNVIFSWPTNVSGFTLQSATNLSPLVNWIDSSNAPGIVGTEFTVTNATTESSRFYRLKK